MLKTHSKPPSLGFLLSHPAHLIACGFGSGLSGFAPGTIGTLFAWATFPTLFLWMNREQVLIFIAISFIAGIFAIQKTGTDLEEVDHGSIVWDEIVPFWIVLYFCPPGLYWQAAAFLIFRVFDIVKPQPARYFDTKVKNGFGVMMDDLIAALYSLLVLYAAQTYLV